MINVTEVRKDFPILERAGGLIYLDSGATSQRPIQVVEAITGFYEEANANVHRGFYALASRATDLYEEAREKVAAFIGGAPGEVVFTRGATEALNLAAYSLGELLVGEGDEIVVTVMEHHANLIPWQQLAARKRAKLVPVGITPEGLLDLDELSGVLGPRTKIVAVTHVSNVLGTIVPVAQVAELVHRAGAVLVVDGAQSAPHLPIDVGGLGADLFAFSAHKMLGPTGIGALWAKGELLSRMPPFLTGGEMIREVWIDHATWADPPAKFEAGTPPVAQAVGFAAAVDYLQRLGMAAVREHDLALTSRALAGMRERDYLEVYGPLDPELRGGVISFNLRGAPADEVAKALDAEGIAVRAGCHCAQPLHRHLGIPSTCRASFYLYNTPEEVDAFLSALDRVAERLLS